MDRTRSKQSLEILDILVGMPAQDRRRYVERTYANDPELRHELLALLEYHEKDVRNLGSSQQMPQNSKSSPGKSNTTGKTGGLNGVTAESG